MAKPAMVEVQVLHFFEHGSLEKAEVLFRIVSDKMRERLQTNGDEDSAARPAANPAKRREPTGSRKAPVAEGPERTPAE
jgi:hypothetical protein